MSEVLLTIIIPTYNRANHLELLLRTLQVELAGIEETVRVIVSDNASTDRTPTLISDVQKDWPNLVAQCHAQNLGAEENFCSCVDRISSRYFWIIGDDDLPKVGVIAQLLALLEEEMPSIVCMQSEWVDDVIGPGQGVSVGVFRREAMNALTFAKNVHVWFTYISGLVIDYSTAMACMEGREIRRFSGTNLVQLGWTLPLLIKSGTKFVFIPEPCVLATKNNTGGYALLTVFGVNFASVAREALSGEKQLSNALISRNIARYLPGLIWGNRVSPNCIHSDENPWPAMRRELGGFVLFWVLLIPLGRFPKPLAELFFQGWRVLNRLNTEVDQFARTLRFIWNSRK